MTLEIKTASELIDPDMEARWATRRAARETEVLQRFLRAFVERPGAVVTEEIVKAFRDRRAGAEPVRRSALQVGRPHDGPAPGLRPARRFRAAGLLPEMPQVRARVPCLAIPFGDKVMFDGYEICKPDVEKCAKYRVTNPKGTAGGRCMKMCPFNLEGLLAHRVLLWLAIRLPFLRRWFVRLDDRVGNGRRNPVKRCGSTSNGSTLTPGAAAPEVEAVLESDIRPPA